MPKYFFHVIHDTKEVSEVGTHLLSRAYAAREGAKLIGAMLADGFLDCHAGPLSLEVTDEAGEVVTHLDVTMRESALFRSAA